MNYSIVAIASFVTLLLSLLLPFAIRPLLKKLQIVDVPNERSSHKTVVLRGMGLAVLISLLVGGGLATVSLYVADEQASANFLLAVGAFSFFAGLLGFGEDLKGVSVGVRSVLLLLIAIGSSAVLVYLGHSSQTIASFYSDLVSFYSHPDNLMFRDYPLWLLIIIAIYGVFFISGYINVANFMDGLNGISGLHGFISGATFAALGWLMAMPWLFIAGSILGLAFAGFLPWNLNKNGAFLGDVGSYLLGGSVAITSFAALAAGVPMLATIGPMVIYFGDVVVTLIKRVRAGFKWDEPHKEHTYQRLQQQGRSHLQTSFIVAGFSLLTAALGVASIFFNGVGWVLFLIGGVAVLITYLVLPKLTK